MVWMKNWEKWNWQQTQTLNTINSNNFKLCLHCSIPVVITSGFVAFKLAITLLRSHHCHHGNQPCHQVVALLPFPAALLRGGGQGSSRLLRPRFSSSPWSSTCPPCPWWGGASQSNPSRSFSRSGRHHSSNCKLYGTGIKFLFISLQWHSNQAILSPISNDVTVTDI